MTTLSRITSANANSNNNDGIYDPSKLQGMMEISCFFTLAEAEGRRIIGLPYEGEKYEERAKMTMFALLRMSKAGEEIIVNKGPGLGLGIKAALYWDEGCLLVL